MANPWIKPDGSQLTIAEVAGRLVESTAVNTIKTYRRSLGVIVEVCDVCDQPKESEAHREHCRG